MEAVKRVVAGVRSVRYVLIRKCFGRNKVVSFVGVQVVFLLQVRIVNATVHLKFHVVYSMESSLAGDSYACCLLPIKDYYQSIEEKVMQLHLHRRCCLPNQSEHSSNLPGRVRPYADKPVHLSYGFRP